MTSSTGKATVRRSVDTARQKEYSGVVRDKGEVRRNVPRLLCCWDGHRTSAAAWGHTDVAFRVSPFNMISTEHKIGGNGTWPLFSSGENSC